MYVVYYAGSCVSSVFLAQELLIGMAIKSFEDPQNPHRSLLVGVFSPLETY